MSVALDAKMTGGNGASGASQQLGTNGLAITATAGHSINVGATATLLVAILDLGSIDITPTSLACTWGGTPMTLACSIWTGVSAGVGAGAAIFTLINPASGQLALAASWASASAQAYLSAISFTGTDTVTGYKVADNVTGYQTTLNPSIAVNTDSAGATVVTTNSTGNSDTVANQTTVFVNSALNNCSAASYALGGSGTNTHNFTAVAAGSIDWAAIHVIAPAVVASKQSSLTLLGVGA